MTDALKRKRYGSVSKTRKFVQTRSQSNMMVMVSVFWVTVCKTVALCYGAVICPDCRSVTYSGQNVGWIKIPLGTEVRLGSGHIV